MKILDILTKRNALVLGFFTMLLACSENHQSMQKSIASTMDTQPEDPQSVGAQVSRYLGQDSFISAEERYPHPILKAIDSSGNQGQRTIQESDLYKFGPEGQKILYVLNPHRGLQVIDFGQGFSQAALLGRAEPSGYSPVEMFRDTKHQSILVIEDITRDGSSNWTPEATTRIVVYDVKDPRKPHIIQETKIPGLYSDSRLVGDILYVATSLFTFQETTWRSMASLNSYAVSDGGLTPADSYTATMNLKSRDSLQIIEDLQGEKAKYFAVLTLNENTWGFWNRKSTVELVDLSDPSGKIESIMQVNTEGEIKERSATLIRNNTLITVTNSWVEIDQQRIRRVSVESFTLPNKNSVVISAEEAEYRNHWLQHELKKKPESATEDSYTRELQRDPTTGLAGVFVRKDNTTLLKIVPDSLVRTQDSNGMHADIQDVRFSGNLLYVFWVPANQKDPLDIFDISHPEAELRFIHRMLFDGWVERSFPLFYKNREFIVALGWVLPPNGSRRQAQAILFELIQDPSGYYQTLQRDQLTLQGQATTAEFNDQDKTIELQYDGAGHGQILFPVQQGNENFKQGAKIVSFSLDSLHLREEATFLANKTGWLRRVFTFPETGRIHALNDQSLDIFPARQPIPSDHKTYFEPQSTIELSKDIAASVPVSITQKDMHLQIIRRTWRGPDQAETEIRLVPFGDADLAQALSIQTIKGEYMAHQKIDKNRLYVLSVHRDFSSAEASWILTELQVLPNLSLSRQQTSWMSSLNGQSPLPHGMIAPWHTMKPGFFFLDHGEFALQTDNELRILDKKIPAVLGMVVLKSDICSKNHENSEFIILNGRAFLYTKISIKAHDNEISSSILVKYWLYPLEKKDGLWSCHGGINIPGRPILVHDSNLIVEDQRIISWRFMQVPWRPVTTRIDYPQTQRTFMSLNILNTKAVLQDIYDATAIQSNIFPSNFGDMIFIEKNITSVNGYLVQIKTNKNAEFFQRSWNLPEENEPIGFDIVSYHPKITSESIGLGLLRQGRLKYYEAQNNRKLQAMEMWKRIDNGSWIKTREGIILLRDFDYLPNDHRIHIDQNKGFISLADGFWGAQDLYVPKLENSSVTIE